MGSYLTIINNTEHAYMCKVGYHEIMLKSTIEFLSLLGAGIGALSGLGLIKSVVLSSAIFGSGLFGSHITGLYGPNNQLKSIRTTMQQFDYFSEHSVPSIETELTKRHFFTINPLASHQYGKMTLGLLRQATCVHVTLVSNVTLDMQVNLLSPIWSSVIPNRSRFYDIRVAKEKKGALHYSVYSARFMDYENKTISVQPIFPISSTQPPVTPYEETDSTSSGFRSSEPASASLTNYQPTSFSASQPNPMSSGYSYTQSSSPDSSQRAFDPYAANSYPTPDAYGAPGAPGAPYIQDSSNGQEALAATPAPSTKSSNPSNMDSTKSSI